MNSVGYHDKSSNKVNSMPGNPGSLGFGDNLGTNCKKVNDDRLSVKVKRNTKLGRFLLSKKNQYNSLGLNFSYETVLSDLIFDDVNEELFRLFEEFEKRVRLTIPDQDMDDKLQIMRVIFMKTIVSEISLSDDTIDYFKDVLCDSGGTS